jgi:transposase
LAQTIVLDTGDIGRFPTVGHYASYCRCVGSTNISNGKRTGQGNGNNGNPYLERACMEAVQFAIRCTPIVQRFYQRQQAKGHRMIVRKAVAHKLARACYYMMRDLVPFDVHKAFGGG